MPILQQIENPEMLIGFILVVISLVGLVGGHVNLSNFTVKFKTARRGSLANKSLFGVLVGGSAIALVNFSCTQSPITVGWVDGVNLISPLTMIDP